MQSGTGTLSILGMLIVSALAGLPGVAVVSAQDEPDACKNGSELGGDEDSGAWLHLCIWIHASGIRVRQSVAHDVQPVIGQLTLQVEPLVEQGNDICPLGRNGPCVPEIRFEETVVPGPVRMPGMPLVTVEHHAALHLGNLVDDICSIPDACGPASNGATPLGVAPARTGEPIGPDNWAGIAVDMGGGWVFIEKPVLYWDGE